MDNFLSNRGMPPSPRSGLRSGHQLFSSPTFVLSQTRDVTSLQQDTSTPRSSLMPRASRRSRAPTAGDASNTLERTPSTRRRRRRRKWLKVCRLLAKQKWRGIGAMGVVTILLAALLLCLTAYFESWVPPSPGSSQDISAQAPTTEDPSYFEDKEIPRVFLDYTTLHNGATASPMRASYVVYEIPGNTTLANSLLGLTSAYLFALMSDRVLLVQWTVDFESPGPNDVAAGNASVTVDSSSPDRTSSLEEVFLDPGFFWSWERFVDRWTSLFGFPEDILALTYVDVIENYNSLVCSNLENFMKDKQFIKIYNSEYFAPLLQLNRYSSGQVLEQIMAHELFASLSNWLIRPVPTVTAAVQKFRERYFEDNYVIVVEMNVVADTSYQSDMPVAQQEMFMKEASDAGNQARSNLNPDLQGIVVLVVTDDETALSSQLEDLDQDILGDAGVVATTGPRGYGTMRILTELINTWLLGFGDVSIVSPGSATGVFGHSRMSLLPIVIEDSQTAHQATSSQPCLADLGLIEDTSCYHQGMRSKLSYDPYVPCLGNPPSTVASLDEARGSERRREL